MKKYTKEHEWVNVEGKEVTLGISEYAAKELGDITFVELPETDDEAVKGEVLTVVESVKAATDVYSPIDGVVKEVNEDLEDNPQIVNESPENKGWICKVEVSEIPNLDGLMDEQEYQNYLQTL